MRIKWAEKYKNWEGPYTYYEVKRKITSPNDLIWHEDLCEGNQTEPYSCRHKPQTAEQFRSNSPNRNIDFYYSKKKEKIPLNLRIDLLTKILALIAVIISLVITCLPDSKNSNDNNDIILPPIIRDENCDCEYEDVEIIINKKKAKFRIAYLTQEKRWKIGKQGLLTNGKLLEDELPKHLPLYPNFKESIGLIAVGLASEEGLSKKREVLRADERADVILDIIRINPIAQRKEFYKLNLGQHSSTNSNLSRSETAYQRRVIIIAILEKEKSMSKSELTNALYKGIKSSNGLNFKSYNYSNFDLKRM